MKLILITLMLVGCAHRDNTKRVDIVLADRNCTFYYKQGFIHECSDKYLAECRVKCSDEKIWTLDDRKPISVDIYTGAPK